MSKVILPKEVAESIDAVWSKFNRYAYTKHMVLTNWTLLKEQYPDQYTELSTYAYSYPMQYMQALVNGYEVEQTPEDKLREYYQQAKSDAESTDYDLRFPGQERVEAILYTLNSLNIKISGVNEE